MKKIIALLLALVMVMTVCTGCGDKKTNGGKNNSGDGSVTVNTEVKGTVTVGVNSMRNSDFDALCEAFKTAYPNVEVKPVLFESTTDDALEYLTSLKMAEKTMPDIIFDDAGPMPSYIRNGWAYPLTSFVEGDEEFENVPENIRDYFKYNDNIYALGQTLHSNVVVINEDLLEEMNVDLPDYDWTWDDFTELIKACTNDTYSGVEDLSRQYNWMPGAMTEGYSIAGYDYETNTFNVEAVRNYVNYYFEIQKLNGVDANTLFSNKADDDWHKKFGDISGDAFDNGKVATIMGGTWSYANYNAKDLDFNWDLYPVPQTSAGRIPMHIDYCWMTTDVKDENLEAAWAFLRYVTYSTEGNLARLTTYDEDHITSDMSRAYYMPVTKEESVVEKFESLPYVTDAIIYIYENFENAYKGDPEKTIPNFEDVEYPIIGKLAYESVTGRDDFTSKMMEAQTKSNQQIADYLQQFNTELAKFEKEFAAK